MAAASRLTASCLAAIALLPWALFWRVTLGQGAFGDGDLFDYCYPLAHVVAEQWRQLRVPLWNPYVFGGTPLHANMQGGALYPPNVLLSFVRPDWVAFHYGILLHFSLAGVFTFLYLRALALARTAAAFGAIAFMLSGFAMGHLGHVGLIRTVPWLPLILFGLERWRRTFDRRYAALAGIATGLMLVAGHPQVPFYALMLSAAYACACILWAAPRDRRRVAVGAALALLAGVGLAAVQILPTLQLVVQEYMRPTERSYGYFGTFSLCPALLVNLVFPRVLPGDESELAVYVGISTLVLALLGAWHVTSGGRPQRRFFMGAAGLALLLAFGRFTPLGLLFFQVPVYSLFMCQARNLFEFDLALAVLAGLGVQALFAPGAARGRREAVAAFVLLAGLGVGLLFLVRALGSFDCGLAELADVTWTHPAVSARLPVVLASLGLVWFFPAARRWRSAACAVLLILLVFDLFSYGKDIYGLYPPSVYTREPAVVEFLKTRPEPGRILTLGQPETDAVQSRAMLAPNVAAAYGIESINGFDSMMLRQIDEASGHLMPTYGLLGDASGSDPRFRRYMDLLNTRYVVTPAQRPLALAAPRYRPVYADERVTVFENTQALPRVFVVHAVRVVTRMQALEMLASGTFDGAAFDPSNVALVEPVDGKPLADDLKALSGSPGLRRPGSQVRILESSAASLRVVVESQGPGLLVHSSNYSRGWIASVDQAAASVLRVDALLQGVPLTAGRHEVLLEYRPRSFAIGATLSLLSLALLAGACWRARPEPARALA